MKGLTALLISGMLAGATPVVAQSAQKDTARKAAQIPADARPPKGMCRIWIDGVPAAQQPAATDCRTAVKNLPPDQRQAIELAFFRGLTHAEIAESLNEPLGTVKARIRRGMLKLRQDLQAYI